MYVEVDETGRIGATTEYKEYASDTALEFDFPEDFDFTKQGDYRIQNGELVYDPEAPSDEVLAYEKAAQLNAQIQLAIPMMVQANTARFTDEQAAAISLLFPDWTVGTAYKEDEIFRYRGNLYRVLQDTTAQEQYTPDNAVSLYKRIGEPDENGVFPWSQPFGATDAYMTGEKVTHNGKTWESTCDNNVWEPGVYGWKEVEDQTTVTPDPDPVEPEPEPEPTPTYEEWKQPTGAHDAYSTGDIVFYNGKLWISTANSNVWAPGVYGWTEYTA